MKIAIGCDHGGFRLKSGLIKFLKASGHTVKDFGTFSEESCDYPIFGYAVAKAVGSGKFNRGILICKTGVGMTVVANKAKRARACVISDMKVAISSREHNDCNIIVFGAMLIKPAKAKAILKVWLKTRALGDRHRRRVEQIKKLEGFNK